jgi:opacity protein-like surface antigen
MNREVVWLTGYGLLATLALALALVPAPCHASDWDRGSGDFLLAAQSASGGKVSFTVRGVKGEGSMSHAYSGGLEVGWRPASYVTVGFDTYIGGNTADAKLGSQVPHANMLFWSIYLDADLNILPYRVTPLLTGGVGVARFDGSWDSGDSFSERGDLTYRIGAGARWNVTDWVLLKAVYRTTWTDLKSVAHQQRSNGFTVGIGITFPTRGVRKRAD